LSKVKTVAWWILAPLIVITIIICGATLIISRIENSKNIEYAEWVHKMKNKQCKLVEVKRNGNPRCYLCDEIKGCW
jgi:hypothetical protein